MRKMTARFGSACGDCGGRIEAGDAILYEAGRKAIHAGGCEKAPAPEVKTENVGSFAEVIAMLEKAAGHLKFPKIRFTVEGVPVKVWKAGPNSKYPGKVMVAENKPYSERGTFFGAIDAAGVFETSTASPAMVKVLTALGSNPVGFASAFGRKTGNCCFCLKALTDERSVSVGYGPICAGHFGLPWGEVEAAPFEGVAPEAGEGCEKCDGEGCFASCEEPEIDYDVETFDESDYDGDGVEGPEPGTWAHTARAMARAFPDDGFDWDAWKDEMKEKEWGE